MIGSVLGLTIAAVGSWLFVRVSIRAALWILLGTTMLVPGTVLVPASTSSYATIHRLVLALFVLNLLRKLARNEIPGSVFRPTKSLAVLGGWVVLTLVLGVAMAEQSYPLGTAVFLWVFVVEYAVFFYVVVAAIRAMGDPWRMASDVVVLTLVVSLVAVYEHFAGVSVSRWLARQIGAAAGVSELGQRGGDVRVQAGFEFALALAWALTILLPLVIVVTMRARNRLIRLAPVLPAVAIVWTYARSAYIGVAAGILLLLLTSRFDPRVVAIAAVGLAGAAAFATATGAYDRTFGSSDVEGSTLVREERLPLILTSAAERPLSGKGLGSISAAGFRTTDSLFLLTYAEIGVVGIAGLGFLLLGTTVWISQGLRAPPPDRLLSAACVCGLLLGITSGVFVDGFTVSGLVRTFWLVAAIGTVVAERAPARLRTSQVRPLHRALVPVVGLAAGALLYAIAPAPSSWTLRFTIRTAQEDVSAVGINRPSDQIVINTVCAIIEVRTEILGHPADCYGAPSGVDVGDVRFEAPNEAALFRDTVVAATVVRSRLPGVRFFVLEPVREVKGTWIRTAPVWMAIAGLAIAVLLPPLPPVRKRDRSNPIVAAPAAA